jgi:hypothetical protein
MFFKKILQWFISNTNSKCTIVYYIYCIKKIWKPAILFSCYIVWGRRIFLGIVKTLEPFLICKLCESLNFQSPKLNKNDHRFQAILGFWNFDEAAFAKLKSSYLAQSQSCLHYCIVTNGVVESSSLRPNVELVFALFCTHIKLNLL